MKIHTVTGEQTGEVEIWVYPETTDYEGVHFEGFCIAVGKNKPRAIAEAIKELAACISRLASQNPELLAEAV